MVKEGYYFGVPLLVLGGVSYLPAMECCCGCAGVSRLVCFLLFSRSGAGDSVGSLERWCLRGTGAWWW